MSFKIKKNRETLLEFSFDTPLSEILKGESEEIKKMIYGQN